MNRKLTCCLLLALAPAWFGCVTHSHATEFNGVAGIRGEPVEYQTTTSYSLNLLFIFSLMGDNSTSATVDAFTNEASERGAERVNITDTGSTTYWYIFPPLSFLIHPAARTVQGTVEGTVSE